MAGLWRKSGIKGGKYLVQRRDGTVPDWQWFVLGSRDPAATVAIRAYADECERIGKDPLYVAGLREMASDFEKDLISMGEGDSDAPPHRKDDPETVAKMINANRGA